MMPSRLPAVPTWIFSLLLSFCLGGIAAHADSETDPSKLIWQQSSEQGVFEVTLDPGVEKVGDDKQGLDQAIEINQFLEWVVTITTPDGEFVTPARVAVSGGMPMHGHGLPSQPQVSEYLGDGKYRLKGLMFSMNGRWELALDIQSKGQRDRVVFDLKIDY